MENKPNNPSFSLGHLHKMRKRYREIKTLLNDCLALGSPVAGQEESLAGFCHRVIGRKVYVHVL